MIEEKRLLAWSTLTDKTAMTQVTDTDIAAMPHNMHLNILTSNQTLLKPHVSPLCPPDNSFKTLIAVFHPVNTYNLHQVKELCGEL